MRLAWLCLVGAMLAMPARAELSMSTALYQCDRAVMVTASYINSAEGSLAVVSADGWDQMVLVNVPAASGARYARPEETEANRDLFKAPYVWWTKGAEASLYYVDLDGNETLLLTCLAAP